MEPDADMQPMFVSYRQAQQLSGLSRGTLWKMVASGEVAASKIGKRVLIDRRSLQAFLESQTYHNASRQ